MLTTPPTSVWLALLGTTALAVPAFAAPNTHDHHHGPRHAVAPAPEVLPPSLLGAPRYSVTDMGSLGNPDAPSYAFALNRYGHVAGTASTSSYNGPGGGSYRAVVFRDGVLVDLLPGVAASAAAINDQGVVALIVGQQPALLRGDSLRFLPNPASEAVLEGLNGLGDVVGWARSGPADDRPFLWRDGVPQDLGTLVPGARGSAADINDDGLVVGGSEDASGTFVPVKWEAGQVVPLHSLSGPGKRGTALAVNRHGDIVGSSEQPGGNGRRAPTIWWRDGRIRGLRPLEVGGSGSGLDINDEGWVVGLSSGPQTSLSEPFLWNGERVLDLNSLIDPQSGWILFQAASINNRGQIAGWGSCSCGAPRGFLLTPE